LTHTKTTKIICQVTGRGYNTPFYYTHGLDVTELVLLFYMGQLKIHKSSTPNLKSYFQSSLKYAKNCLVGDVLDVITCFKIKFIFLLIFE